MADTIEQQARELVDKFWDTAGIYKHEAKLCAILHVELLQKHTEMIANALEGAGIAIDYEHFNNLINAIKALK